MLLTSTAIVAGLILWQITERSSKQSAIPSAKTASDSQTIPANGAVELTLGADGKVIAITTSGTALSLHFSDGGRSVISVTSNSVALTPQVKEAIAQEVKRHIDAPSKPTTRVPPALDPEIRTYVVFSDLTVDAAGRECKLTAGDVITKLTDSPDRQGRVKVSVSASKSGDCASGITVAIPVNDIQQMYNQFQEQLEEGLRQLNETPTPARTSG